MLNKGSAGGGVRGKGGLGGPGLGVAMEFGAAVVGFAIVGLLVDKWLGTMPVWTIVLSGIGVIGGGYNFIRQALAINRRLAEEYRRAHGGKSSGGESDGESAKGMFDRRIVEVDEDDDDDRGSGWDDEGKWDWEQRDDEPEGFGKW